MKVGGPDPQQHGAVAQHKELGMRVSNPYPQQHGGVAQHQLLPVAGQHRQAQLKDRD